jgi:hypothetical protein
MRPFMTDKAVMGMLAALMLAVASPVAAQTPTLAELAKREEARRKAVTAPPKVVTSSDVPKGTAPTPKPAPDGTATKSDDKSGSADDKAGKPDEPVKDAAWWHARVATIRDELRRNEMFVDAMQTKVNSLSADFAARDDPYQRARVGEERTRAIAEMDRAKAEIELQKKKIAEIEEEARRAGVPPGWVR